MSVGNSLTEKVIDVSKEVSKKGLELLQRDTYCIGMSLSS